MFLAKINSLLVCLILLHDSKVYHFQTAPNGACQKKNGRMQSHLETRDDIEIRSGYDSYCLIESIKEPNKLRCLAACNIDCLCYMLTHDGSTCSLYDLNAVNYFTPKSSDDLKVYVKKDATISGLIHHWPMDGSNIDLVGRQDVQAVMSAHFANDRNGKANSSVHFNYGFAQLPLDADFNPSTGGFTVMFWAKFLSLESYMRIFEFANDELSDRAVILLSLLPPQVINFRIADPSDNWKYINGQIYTPTIDTWFHFTASLDVSLAEMSFYVDGPNGVQTKAALPSDSYIAVGRQLAYIGKSGGSIRPYFNGYMDNLKIFNRALTAEEVYHHMDL